MKIKADLHMHLEETSSVDDLKTLLMMCESQKLKAASILSYNSIAIYQENGAFDLLARETNNDFGQYFSGKIIPSVEMVSTIDNIPSKTGKNYEGYRSDIVLYDFDVEKMSKYLNEEELKKAWIEDFNMFSLKCAELGIEIPSIEYFINDFHPLSFVTQWFEMCKTIPGYIEYLESIFDTKLNIASDLTRNHISNPNGKLFFKQKLFPDVSTVLKIAKDVDAKVCIAHPAHMSRDFDTTDYIESLVDFSKSNPDFQPITHACGDYMLNTSQDCATIAKIAKEKGLKLVCGSDLRLVDQMYYAGQLTGGEKVYYTPTPGFAVAKMVELGDGSISMDDSVLKELGDVRDSFGKYSERE